MRRVLRRGFQAFQILEWHKSQPDDTFKEFADKFSALDFLRGFMHDHLNMTALRDILAQVPSHGDLSRLKDHEVLDQLAWRLVSGRVKIAALPLAIPTWAYEAPAEEEEEEPAAVMPPMAEEPHWIEYRFVDAAGNTIAGLSYEFTEVDGSTKKGTLPSNGILRRDGLPITGDCNVKLFSVTNAKWSQNSARVGDLVKLSADVEGYENGTIAVFEIWEMDIGGKDDFVAKINATVQGGKVESEWDYKYIEDTDDVSEEDEKKGYSSPEYYFFVKVKESKARSGLLEFRDWIGIELIDENDNPVANEDYILFLPNGEVRKGKLDANGLKREENIPPGKCQIEFPNQSNVKI